MKRLQKACLIQVRKYSYRFKLLLPIYYWADLKLYELKNVQVMPTCYYRCVFGVCMICVRHNHFVKFAHTMIHKIPYHLRFVF